MLYIAQDADFLGVVQIIVYTGAVMMLFLFVLMLVGVDSSDSLVETITGQRVGDRRARLGLAGMLIVGHRRRSRFGDPVGPRRDQRRDRQRPGHRAADLRPLRLRLRGHQRAAHHRRARARWCSRTASGSAAARPSASWRERRFREGEHLAGLPAPGVYARHNAVDTPALLPDGTPSRAVGLAGAHRAA